MKAYNSIVIRRNDLRLDDHTIFAIKIKPLANGFLRVYKQKWNTSPDIMKKYGNKMLNTHYQKITINSDTPDIPEDTKGKCVVGEDIAVFFAPYIPVRRAIPTHRDKKNRSPLLLVGLPAIKESKDAF